MALRGHITGGFGSSREKEATTAAGKRCQHQIFAQEASWALSLTEQPKPNCLLAKKQGYTFFSRGSSQVIAAFIKEKNKYKPLNSIYTILKNKIDKGGREGKVKGLNFADALHSLAKALERPSQPLIPLGKEAVI